MEVGTAQEVADWYQGLTGYTFHPTVIGQLYARRGMKPLITERGGRIYSGSAILLDLDQLRKSRQRHEK